jgi:subtilase family serine protease
VNQDGEQSSYPLENPQWEPEIALDVEMVSAICPKCHILLVEANSAERRR